MFVVCTLNGGIAGSVERKELRRGFLGDDTSVGKSAHDLSHSDDIDRLQTNPLITSSRTVSSPSSTCVRSTFFLHAFLPFREGCLNCCGADIDLEAILLYCSKFTVEVRHNRYRNVKSVEVMTKPKAKRTFLEVLVSLRRTRTSTNGQGQTLFEERALSLCAGNSSSIAKRASQARHCHRWQHHRQPWVRTRILSRSSSKIEWSNNRERC